MGGRGRRVDGDPRGLVAGRAPNRHGAGRVRVGRGHEGVLTVEDGEVCARGGRGGVGCGDAAGAEGDGDAGGCRGLEGGNGAGGYRGSGDEGLVRKVDAHGEPAALGPVRGRQDGRDGGVVVRGAGPLQRGTGGRRRATVGINCRAWRPGPEAAEARALHFAGLPASGGRARPRP